jgi:hypothetical protein
MQLHTVAQITVISRDAGSAPSALRWRTPPQR